MSENENEKADKVKNHGISSSNIVKSYNNRVLFYADVETKSVATLNEELHKVSITLRQNAIAYNVAPAPICLHINSFGGAIFDGFSAMDSVLNCGVDVHTVVDGVAASAATFLSVCGKKRFMTKNSYMLIHQLSSGFWGKYEDFEDNKQNLDLFMQHIKDIYLKYTKIPKSELKEMLKRDLFFNSEKCLKLGLVDEII